MRHLPSALAYHSPSSAPPEMMWSTPVVKVASAARKRQSLPTSSIVPIRPKQLRGLTVSAAAFRIIRGVNGLLPERRVDVAGRYGIDAHAMLSFVDRQGFGESGDRAFGGHVCRGVELAHAANEAR